MHSSSSPNVTKFFFIPIVLPVPKKQAFKNIFKPVGPKSYRPKKRQGPDTPAKRHKTRLHTGSTFLFFSYLHPYLIVARALREIQYYQSEVMDGRRLISKHNFSCVVREIACDMATKGSKLRFESDALVALQMATEHIMIMIFELTYDIHHSGIIDYRNKLAIHAKRVTIQAKDMSLLWELWHSIDPVSPIGDPTEQRRIIDHAARIESARQARSLPAATRLYNRLEANGQRVPAGLKKFLAAHKHSRRS